VCPKYRENPSKGERDVAHGDCKYVMYSCLIKSVYGLVFLHFSYFVKNERAIGLTDKMVTNKGNGPLPNRHRTTIDEC
jgi:hypothetical protein